MLADLGPPKGPRLAIGNTGTWCSHVASGRHRLRRRDPRCSNERLVDQPLGMLHGFPLGQGDGQTLSGDGLLGADGHPAVDSRPSSWACQLTSPLPGGRGADPTHRAEPLIPFPLGRVGRGVGTARHPFFTSSSWEGGRGGD